MNEWILEVAGIENREVWSRAEVIAGGKRLLAMLPEDCSAEKIELGKAAHEQALELAELARDKKVVVLASGDPLYYGIGGTLSSIVAPENLRIHPGITAFQMLFAELKQPWEKAELFSIHGKDALLPWRRILRAELAAVYGDARRPASVIAAELLAHFPEAAERPAAIGIDLGMSGKQIFTGTLMEMAEIEAGALSVLALLPEAGPMPECPLGLPDHEYRHQANMITHPEVRAIVLSKLRLRSGIMWDLGAGSGSVGLEAAGMCPGLTVYSVEKNAERIADIQVNIEREKIGNICLCSGNIGDVLDELPPPDRIFIGGGAANLERAFECLKPGGILVATGVLVNTVAKLAGALSEYRRELININISRAGELGGQSIWRAENPITVAVYEKR